MQITQTIAKDSTRKKEYLKTQIEIESGEHVKILPASKSLRSSRQVIILHELKTRKD